MSTLNKECIICETVEKFLAGRLQVGGLRLGFFAEKQ